MPLGLFVEKLQPKVGLGGYDILFAYFVVEEAKGKTNIFFFEISFHKSEQNLCLVTHSFTKLTQNVCLIITHIYINIFDVIAS